jgi:hypothetical protein
VRGATYGKNDFRVQGGTVGEHLTYAISINTQ